MNFSKKKKFDLFLRSFFLLDLNVGNHLLHLLVHRLSFEFKTAWLVNSRINFA